MSKTGVGGPGRSHREGMTLIELMEMFPDEDSAVRWFESVVWPNGRCCGHCGSINTGKVPNAKPMPYWCSDCRSYFSVRTGTAIARSNVPMRRWAIAIYLEITSPKSISSMKLHRDLAVTQKTAWFMLHRIREAWTHDAFLDERPFTGPVKADETYIGGKAKNMHASQRRKLTGRGGVDKMAVVGVKNRATRKVRLAVAPDTTGKRLRGFVEGNADPEATVYTDGEKAYVGAQRPHESVKHSVGETSAAWRTPTASSSSASTTSETQEPRADADRRRAAHRPEPSLPEPHRAQRAAQRGAVLAAAAGREPDPRGSRCRSRGGCA